MSAWDEIVMRFLVACQM